MLHIVSILRFNSFVDNDADRSTNIVVLSSLDAKALELLQYFRRKVYATFLQLHTNGRMYFIIPNFIYFLLQITNFIEMF